MQLFEIAYKEDGETKFKRLEAETSCEASEIFNDSDEGVYVIQSIIDLGEADD